jgi:hypothetical protein
MHATIIGNKKIPNFHKKINKFTTKQKPYTSNLNAIRFFPLFITPRDKTQKHQQTCQMITGL